MTRHDSSQPPVLGVAPGPGVPQGLGVPQGTRMPPPTGRRRGSWFWLQVALLCGYGAVAMSVMCYQAILKGWMVFFTGPAALVGLVVISLWVLAALDCLSAAHRVRTTWAVTLLGIAFVVNAFGCMPGMGDGDDGSWMFWQRVRFRGDDPATATANVGAWEDAAIKCSEVSVVLGLLAFAWQVCLYRQVRRSVGSVWEAPATRPHGIP